MSGENEKQVRLLLQAWAAATRKGQKDVILINHLQDVLIYDVLAPMQYEGAAAYRKSWDDWQPETQGEGRFDWEDLQVTSDDNLAFAHGFIRCGGVLPNGKTFEDLVRATFCLRKISGSWMVAHQHISKPIQLSGS